MSGRCVDKDMNVTDEGQRALAFIDTIEEVGHRWMLAQQEDSSYVAAVLIDGRRMYAEGATISEAISKLSDRLIAEGRRGLPQA